MDGANTWPLGNKRGLAELLELGGVMDGWMTLLKDEEKHWVALSESGLQSEGAICEEPEDCIHCHSEAVLALACSLAALRALVAEQGSYIQTRAEIHKTGEVVMSAMWRQAKCQGCQAEAVLALTEEKMQKYLEDCACSGPPMQPCCPRCRYPYTDEEA